jgi:hypothetical protein
MRAWKADRREGFAAALVLTAIVAVGDAALGATTEFIPLLVAGPLLAAWVSGVRETAITGVVSAVVAFLVGLAGDAFLTSRHIVGVLAVIVGSLLASLVVRAREAEREARRRTALLSHAGEVQTRAATRSPSWTRSPGWRFRISPTSRSSTCRRTTAPSAQPRCAPPTRKWPKR